MQADTSGATDVATLRAQAIDLVGKAAFERLFAVRPHFSVATCTCSAQCATQGSRGCFWCCRPWRSSGAARLILWPQLRTCKHSSPTLCRLTNETYFPSCTRSCFGRGRWHPVEWHELAQAWTIASRQPLHMIPGQPDSLVQPPIMEARAGHELHSHQCACLDQTSVCVCAFLRCRPERLPGRAPSYRPVRKAPPVSLWRSLSLLGLSPCMACPQFSHSFGPDDQNSAQKGGEIPYLGGKSTSRWGWTKVLYHG